MSSPMTIGPPLHLYFALRFRPSILLAPQSHGHDGRWNGRRQLKPLSKKARWSFT